MDPFNLQQGTPTKEAIDSQNNHPHIVRFIDASGGISPTHFIAVEQQLLLECRNIESALYLLVATHFVFNIEYCPKVKDILYFFQEKIICFPDSALKQSSVYRNVSSAIDLYLPQ